MTGFYHLVSWILAWMYRLVKRRPLIVSLGLVLVIMLVFFSLKWGLVCSNMGPLYVQPICMDYKNGVSIGTLCKDLCEPNGITSVSCETPHTSKEAVFSGVHGNNSIVFKLPKKNRKEELYWLDNSYKKIYPTETDFFGMITTSIKFRFNISVNQIDAKKMSYILYAQNGPLRAIEMETVWHLLQDNEYVVLLLYAKFDIFPQLLGSCGPLYAVQKLYSLPRFGDMFAPYNSEASWVRRVKISVMILDFLTQMEYDLIEPLRICDVQTTHFGVTSDFKKVQYLDLSSVHPLSVANRITRNGAPCKQHSDCDYLDCRSFCNLVTWKCEFGVVNDNLQVVCEKVFLGWVWGGRLAVGGLLQGPRAPRALAALLRACADPAGDAAVPRAPAARQIGARLRKILVHLASQ